MSAPRPRLLVLVGPTAVGKTALSLRLAGRFAGSIVSADSRQIYHGMDIGTAKPAPAELAAIPHYLIDIVPPDTPFGLAQYQALACQAIDQVRAADRLPMLVGGTGQYVRAILEGWRVPHVPPQPEVRRRLLAEAETQGADALHRRLALVDPDAAARIDARNVRRVVRALEVYEVTGVPISALQVKDPPAWDVLQIGLRRPRDELYARIDARVDAMMAAGLLDEVRWLESAGYGPALPAMSSMGYAELFDHLRGATSLDEAVAQIKASTRRFVRRQANWFREDDPAVAWFHADDAPAVDARVTAWLKP